MARIKAKPMNRLPIASVGGGVPLKNGLNGFRTTPPPGSVAAVTAATAGVVPPAATPTATAVPAAVYDPTQTAAAATTTTLTAFPGGQRYILQHNGPLPQGTVPSFNGPVHMFVSTAVYANQNAIAGGAVEL